MDFWSWFLPASERQHYTSNIMEGPHGGSGEPMSWGAAIVAWAIIIGAVALLALAAWVMGSPK